MQVPKMFKDKKFISATLEELRGFMHETVLEQMKTNLPQSNIRSIRYVRAR
jgi:hypothetical protein